MDNSSAIGVFDSGLGGLTVAREVIRALPEERIVYFGDTARVPYGSKSASTIRHYAEQILAFLKTQDVKAIVVACNTVSAYALEDLRHSVPVPVVGVVKPGARVAAAATKNRRIGVIGTEGTVKSGLYERFICEIDPGIRIFQKACPLFVPLVEEGWWKDSITREVAERYLAPLKEEGVDTLIMGCTHYPLIRKLIGEVIGPEVQLINPAYETAQELMRVLSREQLLRTDKTPLTKEEQYRFYVSDAPEKFRAFAEAVLHFETPDAERVNIEAY